MFKFGAKAGGGPADRGQFPLLCGDQMIATYVSWAFCGCGSAILTNLGNHYGDSPDFFWNNKEKIDALVDSLSKNKPNVEHNAEEFYMLLSESQFNYGGFGAFKEHPNVGLVDKYKKKPYDGTPLYLYRLSIQKDFDGLKKKTKATV